MAINLVHNLGNNNMRFHCFEAHGSNFAPLRHRCVTTPFNAEHSDIENLFDPNTIRSLFQTDDEGCRMVVKAPDGHVLIVRGHDGEDRVQGFLKDAAVCAPEGLGGKIDEVS